MKKKNCLAGLLLSAFLAVSFTACGGKNDAYKQAMELAEDGKYDQSLSYFETALKEDETDPEYSIGYGMTLNHLAKYDQAKEIFEKVQKSEDKVSGGQKKQIYFGAAVAAFGSGEYESAVQYAEKALSLKKTHEDLNKELYYMEAVALFMQGKVEASLKLCDKLLSEDQENEELQMLNGNLKKASGDYEGAIQAYESIIKANDTAYDAYFALYNAYQGAGQDAAAEELLENLTSMDTEKPEHLLAIGEAWFYKRDYEKAIDYFQKAYDKKETKGLYYIALMKKMKGNLKDAEKEFLDYIASDKEDVIPEVYNQLAGIYMERSKYAKAQKMLTTGLALGDTSALQNLMRNQVILYELQGKYKKALVAATEYIQIYTTDKEMKKEIDFIQTRIS